MPDKFRIKTDIGTVLSLLLATSVFPGQASGTMYDFLLLSQPIETGEEFLAACCEELGDVEAVTGTEKTTVVRLGLRCYMHVFNEPLSQGWDNLPVIDAVELGNKVVLIV